MPGPDPVTPPAKRLQADKPPAIMRSKYVAGELPPGGNPNLRQRLLGRLELVAPQHPHDAGLAAMFAAVHM